MDSISCQIVRKSQPILKKNPSSFLRVKRESSKLQASFWVGEIRIMLMAYSRFVALRNLDLLVNGLNDRSCLRSLGLDYCRCGKPVCTVENVLSE
jgi:hypothetical protein